MARVPEISICPKCGAKGVKRYDPIQVDGHFVDVPYCGICGKNWPSDTPLPRSNVTPFEPEPTR